MLIGRFLKTFFSNISTRNFINDDKILLKNLKMLTDRLRSTNSLNDKVKILKDAEALRGVLETIYSPTTKFFITSDHLIKYKGTKLVLKESTKAKIGILLLTDLLDKLNKREISGNAAIMAVHDFIRLHPEYEELIYMIIDKNLKARIGYDILKRAYGSDKEIQIDTKVIDIPCQLGYSVEMHENYLKKSLERGEKWFISRKYDGIRAFIKFDHETGVLEILSRSMSPISNINPFLVESVKNSLERLKRSVVLDGELVYLSGFDREKNEENEDFSKTLSMVKSLESKPIEGLEYRVFDLFLPNKENFSFSKRQEHLRNLIHEIEKNSNFSNDKEHETIIKIVEQDGFKGALDVEDLVRKANDLKYEGFILRRDTVAQNGRSRDLLKIKPFLDAEFTVTNYQIGLMRLINSDSKTEVEESVLLSITIEHCGEKVNVGSGFNNSERRAFGKDPTLILGKIVTIRYQNESKAKGRRSKSLRFPIFKALHGDTRNE